jgi:hypothetical protein
MKLHTNLRQLVIHAFFYSFMRLQPGPEHSQNLKILFIRFHSYPDPTPVYLFSKYSAYPYHPKLANKYTSTTKQNLYIHWILSKQPIPFVFISSTHSDKALSRQCVNLCQSINQLPWYTVYCKWGKILI